MTSKTKPVLPNFLLIGAAKSGTTSLAEYLGQHPEIYFCPVKEPNYFVFAGQPLPPPGPVASEVLYQLFYSHCVTDYEKYLSLFQGVQAEKAIGEGSVRYLYYPEAPLRIKDKIPDVRLVAILREPVGRLYSHYSMNVQYQLEPLPLKEAITAEPERRAANWGWDWHYVGLGLYYQQLKRYFDLFPREQIKVVLYDDFVADPQAVFKEICRHIGVDDGFSPDMSSRGMVSSRPKNLALDRWLHWPRAIRPGVGGLIPRKIPKALVSKLEQWNSAPIPKIDPELRRELQPLFEEDVEQLAKLLGRPIPWYARKGTAKS